MKPTVPIAVISLACLAACGETSGEGPVGDGGEADAGNDSAVACVIPTTANFALEGGAGCQSGGASGCLDAICCDAGFFLISCQGNTSPPSTLNCPSGVTGPGPDLYVISCCTCQ